MYYHVFWKIDAFEKKKNTIFLFDMQSLMRDNLGKPNTAELYQFENDFDI